MYLIIDTPNLCYRAMYTTGALNHDGRATGVVFGVLRDVQYLTRTFATDKIIFCFDHGRGLREQLVPTYKEGRRNNDKDLTPEERKKKQDMREQMGLLKTNYLADLGYRNVWYQEGYEADDLIATFTRYTMCPDESAVIISGDKDLHQLLRKGVTQRDLIRKTTTTHTHFSGQHGVEPLDWRMVKAIAGCVSDSVYGVEGVGEKTALKYLRGELARHTNGYKKIKHSEKLINSNMRLVSLPFMYPPPEPRAFEDHPPPAPEQWNALAAKLGMHSLEQKADKRPSGFGIRERVVDAPRKSKRQ